LWQNLEAVGAGEVYPVNPVLWNMGAGILAANLMLDEVYQHYGLANTLPTADLAC
jgi:iron complex transport system substrate-binding protein